VMVGGEADEATCDALQNAWSGSPVLPVRGLPLVQLAAVLERCLLFIGHDSGISHIAAAVGTPAVLLFGGTDPKIWAPANPNAKILQAPGGMLDSLTPETVFQAVMEMMA